MGEGGDITCSIGAEETKQWGQERRKRPRRDEDSARCPVPSDQMQIPQDSIFYPAHTLICLSLCSNSLPLSSPHLGPLLPPPTLGCSVSLWLPCIPPVRPSQDLWVEHRGPSHTMGKGPAYPCLPLRPQLSPLLTPPAPRAPSVELFLIPPPARAGLETPSVSS